MRKVRRGRRSLTVLFIEKILMDCVRAASSTPPLLWPMPLIWLECDKKSGSLRVYVFDASASDVDAETVHFARRRPCRVDLLPDSRHCVDCFDMLRMRRHRLPQRYCVVHFFIHVNM